MEQTSSRILLYEYGKHPISKLVNILPGKKVVDERGNIYEIEDDLNVRLIKQSPLKVECLYTDLTGQQMRLFKALSR